MKIEYNYIPQRDTERIWKIKDVHDGRGFGVYCNRDIKRFERIGETHYVVDTMAIVITELGKFHNHSEKPNCSAIFGTGGNVKLMALRNIDSGEELTADYKNYSKILNIEKPNPDWKIRE